LIRVIGGHGVSAVISVMLLYQAPASVCAADGAFTFATGFDYSQGTFGDAGSTVTVSMPVVLKYETGRSSYKLSVPHIRETAPSGGNVIGVDDSGNPITDGVGPRSSELGLGDAVIGWTYELVERPWHGVLVDVTGKVKLPTGNKAKGFSTGKADYTLLADVYFPAGAFTPFAGAGYRVTGNPDGLALRDIWLFNVGLGYKLSGRNSVGAMYDLRQATRPGFDGLRELTVYWVHKPFKTFKIQTYLMRGFGNTSAELGGGLVLSRIF